MNEISCNELIEKFIHSTTGSVMMKQKKIRKVFDKEEIQLMIPNNKQSFFCKNTIWDYEFYQKLYLIKERPNEYYFSQDPNYLYITKKL